MNRIIIFFSATIFITAIWAEADPEKKVLPPTKIIEDNLSLSYNSSWQDKETYIETNLDDDLDPEVIISFVSTYKPKPNVRNEQSTPTFIPRPAETVVIQNFVFYQIYDKGPDGHFNLVKTIRGMDQLGKVELVKLDGKSPPAIVIYSPGGEHYLDLAIYQWREGGFRLLFNKGSSYGIELDAKDVSLRIRIGKLKKNNGEKIQLWETFIWDDEKNDFMQLN